MAIIPTLREVIIDSSDGKCFICETIKDLNLDHNHKTGKNRGILCFTCNIALGFIESDGKDPVAWAKKVVKYLGENRELGLYKDRYKRVDTLMDPEVAKQYRTEILSKINKLLSRRREVFPWEEYDALLKLAKKSRSRN